MSRTTTHELTTIAAVKIANAAAGHFFFEPASMRFFNSAIGEHAWPHLGGAYFVTSEQHSDEPRAYTVRYCQANGHIATVGDFQGHASYIAAQRVISELIAA